MVIAVEGGNLVDRFVDIAADLEQMQVARRNQALLEHVTLQKAIPVLPIGAARSIYEDDGHQVAFTGLQQRQGFKGFVMRAKASRKERKSVCLFHKDQLPHEEVFKIDQLRVVEDHLIG